MACFDIRPSLHRTGCFLTNPCERETRVSKDPSSQDALFPLSVSQRQHDLLRLPESQGKNGFKRRKQYRPCIERFTTHLKLYPCRQPVRDARLLHTVRMPQACQKVPMHTCGKCGRRRRFLPARGNLCCGAGNRTCSSLLDPLFESSHISWGELHGPYE